MATLFIFKYADHPIPVVMISPDLLYKRRAAHEN